ncbi:MAG: sulfite exporter TauE/SafE family protein [Bryobacterales bacterium]|nr:sulfite exporter TauE/SafE family protein [Bryobacterales bacterium]
MLEVLCGLAAVVAGAVASVAGFGIGSILTPLLSLTLGTQLAVAAISIPHVFATAARFWMLRQHVDRRVLLSFGLLSAAGGLTGALLHSVASNPALTLVFSGLLIFAGITGITGQARRMRFGAKVAWVAGALSEMLGGLVGNQGGIRSAALLGFGLDRKAFVATTTAVGLIVDAARMPVYLATSASELRSATGLIVLTTVGVLVGTALGTRFLRRIPEERFHRIVGGLILALGIFMLVRAARGA